MQYKCLHVQLICAVVRLQSECTRDGSSSRQCEHSAENVRAARVVAANTRSE